MHIDLTQPFNGKPKTRPGVIRPDAPRFDPTALTPTPTPPTQNPNPNPAPEPAPETIPNTQPAPMTAIAQPTAPAIAAAPAPVASGATYTVDLVREKDCKHSVRFAAAGDLVVVDTVYINRLAPETATARGVRVTLQFIP